MKKIFLTILLVICFYSPAWAADYYISQSGGGNGTSCNSPYAISWSWSGVNAGDTVHLCGTFTSTLTIPKGGGLNNPITIKFESGAMFSAAYWGPSYSNAAIYNYGNSNITIDGGTNGTIEATDNGDSKTNHVTTGSGVYSQGGDNIEIKNLTISNMWVRVFDASVYQAGMQAIYIGAANNVYIHDNVIHGAAVGVWYTQNVLGTKTNVNIYHNTIYDCVWGIGGPLAYGSGTNLTNVNIYNNDITMGANWSHIPTIVNGQDTHDLYHCNGLYSFNTSSGSLSGWNFYNNYIHPPSPEPASWTNNTTWMWIEGVATDIKVYNNLFVGGVNGGPSNGFLQISVYTDTSHWAQIYNNTIVGTLGQAARGISYSSGSGTGRPNVSNNIIVGTNTGMYFYDNQGDAPAGDNNLFYNNNYDYFFNWGAYFSIAGWKSHQGCSGGFLAWWKRLQGYSVGSPANKDCNSISAKPLLNGDYTLSSSSPAKWAGTASGQPSTTDKPHTVGANVSTLGVTWHSPPSIGAYEYESGATRIKLK